MDKSFKRQIVRNSILIKYLKTGLCKIKYRCRLIYLKTIVKLYYLEIGVVSRRWTIVNFIFCYTCNNNWRLKYCVWFNDSLKYELFYSTNSIDLPPQFNVLFYLPYFFVLKILNHFSIRRYKTTANQFLFISLNIKINKINNNRDT